MTLSAPPTVSTKTLAIASHMRLETSRRVTYIRPTRGVFDIQLDLVWRFRGLLATLVRRDILILYRQAALGAAWAIIQPVFAVIIFTVVFGVMAKMPTPGKLPYALFAFAAVLPWNYFAECVRRGGGGLVQEEELIRKVYFPRLLVPLAAVIGPLLDLAIGFCVLLVLMACYGLAPTWRIIFVLPLTVLAGALALAIGMWLGPINVRYRDVKHTLPFMLQIWMYASPVVYAFSMVPTSWRWLYALNPMVGVIEGFRWAVLGKGAPDVLALCLGAGITVALLLSGVIFFKRMERSFADLI